MAHYPTVSGMRQVTARAMPLLLTGLGVLLVLAALLGVCVGAVAVPLSTILEVVMSRLVPGSTGGWPPGWESIIWEVRIPRVLLGGVVGAGLSLVGATLQSITRNPLTDPHLLGISSGAALGAIVVLLHLGMILGLVTVPIFAFGGALVATGAVIGVAQITRSTEASRLVLAGVAISFVLSSLSSYAIFLGDPRAAQSVIFWMLGGLGLAQWGQLPFPVAALAICGSIFLINARNLNAMTLGDESATTLGIPAQRFRMLMFIACALLTGAMVAYSGVISFVGLMIPHLTRMIVGGDYRRVLPVSGLLGAIFLVIADLIARTIIAPRDVPIGVLTGLIGGAFVVLMLSRRRM